MCVREIYFIVKRELGNFIVFRYRPLISNNIESINILEAYENENFIE